MINTLLVKQPLIAIIFLFASLCFADNPIIQTNYTADPAPMVIGDTVYLYTSHDEDNAQGFVMINWMLYTSTDLVNWTDRGIIASLKSFSWENGNAWAPQCAFRNGKYYLYCPLNKKGGNISIGVLVSNSPYGPFTDPLDKPLVTNNSNQSDYDPSIFVDDDGQAYLYFGGNGPCYYVKLKNDMITLADSIRKASIDLTGASSEASYTEGPWLYKRNNYYYLTWASRCCPEGIGYAMSKSPMGPWKSRGNGLIMAPNSRSSGNHPGIMDFKGKTYVFGFNYELLYTRIPYSTTKPERRSICLAEMTFNDADSSIKQVPWFGSPAPQPGVAQLGNLNPYDTTQAETICWSFGVRTEVCSEGRLDVDSIHNNDFIKVKGVDFGTGGANSFIARVASATNGGNIELHLDSLKGAIIGTCPVSGTSGWQTWTTKTCTVTGATGVHDLYLKFTGNSGLLFNFNWWKFNAATGINGAEAKAQVKASEIKVTVDAGKIRSLRLDFPQPVSNEKLDVSLFDLTGRLVATPFTGRLSSDVLVIPLNKTELQMHAYIVRVSLDNKTVITKTLVLY